MFDRFIAQRTRTRDKDARRACEAAAREGQAHGRRGFPRPASPGGIVDDHFATARWIEAETAATLAIADHLAAHRPHDDAAVDRAAGATLRRTAETADARRELTRTLRRLAAVEGRSTLARWDRPWPPWLRLGLLVLMAVGSIANLAGGLVGTTADDPGYALGYSISIGIGLVGLGAVIGQMLKRWELNRLQPHEHVATRSRVPAAVVALGLAAALALVVAVASIRSTAAELEARRLADAAGAAVQVLGDGSDGSNSNNGGDDNGASSGETGSGAAVDPAIPTVAWGLLEAVLVAGALLVEYAGSMPWAGVRRGLERQVRRRRRIWRARRRRLAQAWTALRSACNGRAARDASMLVTGEAALLHADVETSTYRYENLASRPSPELWGDVRVVGRVGDAVPGDRTAAAFAAPRFTVESPATTPIADVVAGRWGLDLRPLDGTGPDFGPADDPADRGDLTPSGDLHGILAEAQRELQRAPEALDADLAGLAGGGPVEATNPPATEMWPTEGEPTVYRVVGHDPWWRHEPAGGEDATGGRGHPRRNGGSSNGHDDGSRREPGTAP
jgi:hypothetical protein